jgi:quercetin dioxygenase-like cupin family protein
VVTRIPSRNRKTWVYNGCQPGEEVGRSAEEHTEENEMKKLLIVSGVGALIIAVTAGVVQAQKASTRASMKNVIYVAADSATFKPTPGGGSSMATLFGDPDKGVHGTFTKFEPGFDAKMHSHTSDVWIVVLKGAYLYKDEDGEKRVGPGDFIRIPGGHKHWSGGDKTEGALFYEEASGKFDLIPAK